MPRVSFQDVYHNVNGIFSIRHALATFLGLMILLVCGLAIGGLTIGETKAPPEKLSGKVMGRIVLMVAKEEPTVPDKADTQNTAPEPTADNHAIPTTDSEVGLFENTPYGPLPIIRLSDKATAFRTYQPAFKLLPTAKGLVALVMVDYGLSDTLSKQATLTLPPGVTFAASPYATNTQAKVTAGRSYGHEVWMTLPIDDGNFSMHDFGPVTMLSGLKKEQNETRMKSVLGKATGYVGVLTTVVPAFADNQPSIDMLFTALKDRGIGFASAQASDELTKSSATSAGVPYARGDMWIDSAADKSSIMATLSDLESKALANKSAIAFFHPRPNMFPIITEWESGLKNEQLQLVPLSATIRK